MNPLLRKMADAVGLLRRVRTRDPEGSRLDGIVGDSGELVNASNVMALSAVFACVNLIAGTISSLPLQVFRTLKDGQRELAKDHPLYPLLHDSPNFDQTALDFWDYMSSAVELWGNAYARIERDAAGIVTCLQPIPPDAVAPRRVEDGSIEYRWSERGRSFVEPAGSVLHIRGPGGNPLGGMSTLYFGRHAFALARATDRAAGSMFANGLRPSGVLTFDDWLSAEQREIAEDRLVGKFTGAINAGRPMILEGGTTWTPLTINPEDAQMLESRAFSVEEICRFFAVPPVMIGHTSGASSWPSSVEQQGLILQKFTLRRRVKRIEQALMKQLLGADEREAGITIELNLDALLRGDSVSRAAFYQSGLTNGWLKINEVRKLENYPPVKGGDVPRMQIQNAPITQAGAQSVVPSGETET